jgi:hypothetical protein
MQSFPEIEVADARLSTDASRYMTGSIITVDGAHVVSTL